MKKKVLLVPALLLLLTGCGSNKLVCTTEKEDSGVKMAAKATFTFDKEAISKVDLVADVTIPDEYKDMKDILVDSLKSEYDEYKEYGADVNVEAKDNSIKAKISFDATKMSKENLEGLEEEGAYFKGTKEEVKKALEEEGYKCK